MKAPFSKKARQVFSSKKAMSTIINKKSKGESIHGLSVKGRNGRTIHIRTSERNHAPA